MIPIIVESDIDVLGGTVMGMNVYMLVKLTFNEMVDLI